MGAGLWWMRSRAARGKGRCKRTHLSIERGSPRAYLQTVVSQPVQTGYKAIDAYGPIGRRAGEIIIGTARPANGARGDTIITRKSSGISAYYVRHRPEAVDHRHVVRISKEHGAHAHTVVVAASASAAPALQYIAATRAHMGEYSWTTARTHLYLR